MRHGETSWNAQGRPQGIEDIPLNLAGIKQSISRQDLFAGHDLKVVVSPLIRAKKCALLATARANVLSFEVDDRLIEYDFGDQSREPEDIDEFVKRIAGVIIDYARVEGNILIVTHGAVLGELLGAFLTEEEQDKFFHIYNCSISVIDYDSQKQQLFLRGISLEDNELEKLLTENDEKNIN